MVQAVAIVLWTAQHSRGRTIGWICEGTKGGAMPRQQPARDEHDDSFREEPRYERLLQRTDVELAWIYDRHPDLKHKIGTYLAAKVIARQEHVRAPG